MARRREQEGPAAATARQQAALLALAHDAIIVRTPDGRILTWNDGAGTLYGWSVAEAVGQTTHGLLQTRVLSTGGAGAETDAALVAQGAWEGELEHRRRDGTRVVVESRQALLRAADGTPEAILEVNRDASGRQALTAALAQLQTLQAISEAAFAQLGLPALLRQVLERITAALAVDNTAILLLDETENTLVVHHAVGPEEMQTGQMRVPVGQGVAGRIAATRQPLILDDLRAAEPVNPLLREQLASLLGVPLLVEGRLLGVLHVDSATPRRFTQDELHLLQLVADRVALALDNARLYEAERVARAAMTAERDRLQQILDTLPVGVLTLDAAGQLDRVNAAGRDLLGVDARGRPAPLGAEGTEDIPAGRRQQRIGAGALPLPEELPVARSFHEGAVVTGEEALLHQAVTGQDLPVLVNSAPLHDAAGTVVGAVAAFQDLTALRELERAREAFLSAAAHDLKTPLTSIRGQAQLAQRRLARLDTSETAPVLAQLARIQESSDTMVGLIDELMDVTRQQLGGGLDLHRTPTDLVALVQESVESHQAASGRTIQLEVAVPALPAEVDAARLARVVGNLLANALKYSPEGSAIGVGLGQEEGAAGPEAVLVVRDEGIGIPVADLPHIFERFTRARNVAGHIQGTGIGLASARGIVEQHGGAITVESTEGVGSTFTVRLPLAPP